MTDTAEKVPETKIARPGLLLWLVAIGGPLALLAAIVSMGAPKQVPTSDRWRARRR